MKSKRGLSPVIAVMLLIVVAILMAVIFFSWAKSFTKEKEQKLGQAADTICEKTSFVAEIRQSTGEVVVTNTGNIHLHGAKVKEKSLGFEKDIETEYFPFKRGLAPGATDTILFESQFEIGRDYIVIPVLLTETTAYRKPYICNDATGRTVEVV